MTGSISARPLESPRRSDQVTVGRTLRGVNRVENN